MDGWSILAVVAVLVTHAAAQRFRAGDQAGWKPWPILLAAAGTLLWMGLCWRNGKELAVTGGWLIGAAILLAVQRAGRRQRYLDIAMLVLVASAGRWLIIDALIPRLEVGWKATDTLPLLNWQMGLALAIAAAGWWAFRALRQRAMVATKDAPIAEPSARGWQMALVAAVLLLVALSF